MSKKPKWQGKKSTGSHTSLIPQAQTIIEKAEKLLEVSKISLGIIKSTPGTRGKIGIKCVHTDSGLKVTVRGNSSVQEIWMYTNSPKQVQTILEAVDL